NEDKSTGTVKRRGALEARSTLSVGLTHDLVTHQSGLALEGHVRAQQVLRIAQAFGRTVNHGWDMNGETSGAMQWNWSRGTAGRWDGKLSFSRAELQVAGLNQPLLLDDAGLTYVDGKRTVEIAEAQGFGANWSGQIAEATAAAILSAEAGPQWQFRLQADK